MKSPGERRLEAMTWGLLLVWLGIMMAIQEQPGLTGVVAGGILLVSALIQKAVGWQAGAVLWVAGIVLVLSGANEMLGDREVPVAAIILIVLGVLVMLGASGRGARARARWAGSDRRPPSKAE